MHVLAMRERGCIKRLKRKKMREGERETERRGRVGIKKGEEGE